MNKEKVKQILLKSLIKENVDLERLTDEIRPSTMIGKDWIRLVRQLESFTKEVQDFPDQYITAQSGQPKQYTKGVEQGLEQISQLLEQMYATVRQMDQIEFKDMMS